ncbi:ankyrin [Xylariaceae sp. FL1651]|nr:ankyrin [Xylariaceae sp. FL1651]
MQSYDSSPTTSASIGFTLNDDNVVPTSLWRSAPSAVNSHRSSLTSSTSLGAHIPENKKRRPGRPATARRIWQQPVMKRRLVRLYLYTDESTLSTKQISQLISALARHEENKTSVTTPKPLPKSACTQSETRSTQYELQKLLREGYRGLRPRNREEARARFASFRRVRHGRIEKDSLHRCSRHSQSGSRPSSSQTLRHHSDAALALGDFADPSLRDGRAEAQGSARQSSASICSAVGDVNARSSHHSIRLSWVREKLSRKSKNRPSSSVLLEIRSLLSRLSARSSLFSRYSAITTKDSLNPDPDDTPEQKRGKVVQMCCSHQTLCLHRKFLMTASNDSLPSELRNEGLLDQDFTLQHGRDIWNETPLHLAAGWAPDASALPLLLLFLERCESQLVNVKNIDGETFMHILARRWCSLEIPPSETLASFCSRLSDKGFHFGSCNLQGQTFLGSFIEQAKATHIPTHWNFQALSGLNSLLSLPMADFWALITTTSLDLSISQLVLEYMSSLEQSLLLEEKTAPQFTRSLIQQYRDRLLPLSPPNQPSPNQLHSYLECQNWGPVIDSVRFLDMLRHNADPNQYNAEGRTCVVVIIQKIKNLSIPEKLGLELLSMLLYHGADLRLLDRMGNTALHYAVRARLPNVVQQLIIAGIDVHARNAYDETAPQLAFDQYMNAARCGVDNSGTLYAQSQSTLVRFFEASLDYTWHTLARSSRT